MGIFELASIILNIPVIQLLEILNNCNQIIFLLPSQISINLNSIVVNHHLFSSTLVIGYSFNSVGNRFMDLFLFLGTFTIFGLAAFHSTTSFSVVYLPVR